MEKKPQLKRSRNRNEPHILCFFFVFIHALLQKRRQVKKKIDDIDSSFTSAELEQPFEVEKVTYTKTVEVTEYRRKGDDE